MGGAGIVAQRLNDFQSNLLNYESEFIFDFQGALQDNLFVDLSLTTRVILDNKIIKKRDQKVLLSLYRNREKTKFFNLIESHNGITHLHWVNGLVNFRSLSKLLKIGKKLVWTFHDMEPFTGGCHNTLDCDQLVSGCSNCPIVYSPFKRKVKNQFHEKESFNYSSHPIFYIFPSKWMMKKFQSTFPGVDIQTNVIANPISSSFFNSKVNRCKTLDPFTNSLIVGFVSNSLADPLKRFDFVVKILNEVSARLGRDVTLVAIGHPAKVNEKNSKIKIVKVGYIDNEKTISEIYASLDILISASLSESFGLSIAEAGALGIPSLVQIGTGSSEIVSDGQNGLVANNESEFINKLIMFSTNKDLREKLSRNIKLFAKKNWHVQEVASKYDKVYSQIN